MGREDDEPTRRTHGLPVFNQRVHLRGADAEAVELALAAVGGGKVERDALACGQGHGARLRDQNTAVAHFGGKHGDVTAQARLDAAFVDDAAGGTVALKAGFAGHEVGIGHLVRGGHDAAHVDRGARRKVHARRVDEIHLAVGVDLAVDLAGVGGQHAVERHAALAGLHKVDRGLAADVEAAPVDDGAVAGLIDGQGVGVLDDAGLTGSHLPASGQLRGRRWRGHDAACDHGQCQCLKSVERHAGTVTCTGARGRGRLAAGLAGAGLHFAAATGRFAHGHPGQANLAPDDFEDAVQCGVHGKYLRTGCWR